MGGPSFGVGPVTLSSFTLFGYVAPELRAGIRLGAHVVLSAGVEALVHLPFSQPPRDPATPGPDAGPRRHRHAFPSEKLLGKAVVAFAPGVGLRYDF